MQLIRNSVILFLISMALLVTPASAAYVVTLTNGETISAEDYKINDRTIELKMEGGSASFRRSLVASISAGGMVVKLTSQPSYAKPAVQSPARTPGITERNSGIDTSQPLSAVVQSPVRTPGTTMQNYGNDALQTESVDKDDAEVEPEEGVKPEDNMTVGEFLDKESEDGNVGDESVDAADQDGSSEDEKGFMPEDEGQGNNTLEE